MRCSMSHDPAPNIASGIPSIRLTPPDGDAPTGIAPRVPGIDTGTVPPNLLAEARAWRLVRRGVKWVKRWPVAAVVMGLALMELSVVYGSLVAFGFYNPFGPGA